MKSKMKGVMGAALAFVLLSSLFGFATPVSAQPLPTINAWAQFNYPAEGSTGPLTSGWFWDPDITELGPMDRALNGDIYIYARVPGDANGEHKILRSTDGGRFWTDSISPFRYGVVSGIGNGEVVDMVCSSLLEDVIYVTDGDYVYKSSDNAGTWGVVGQADLEKAITCTCGTAITGQPITCIDVGYDAGNNPFVFIGVTTNCAGDPDILYINELAIGATWISLDLSCYDPAPLVTTDAVYTPYAVGVTPDFATAPIKLMAVVTTPDDDGTATGATVPETHVISSSLGVCGWGFVAELYKDCNTGKPFQIDHSSRIGYPDDYVDGRMLFVGVASITDIEGTTSTDGGDVYSVVTFPVGLATDLNVAGSVSGCIGLTEGTNICGLDVCGDTADAAVIAGAMDGNPDGGINLNDPTAVYTSIDGGWTWVTSLKDPTGVDETWVQWVGDDCGAAALASTKWCDCAVSITCGPDVGLYWNQAALINTCFTCVLYGDHSPGYYQAGVSDTMFMLAVCADACLRPDPQPCYSVYRYIGDPTLAGTSSPAHPWERVFSSRLYAAQIDTTDAFGGNPIEMLMVSPDFLTTNAVFIGNSGFEIWRSLDAGCSWFKFAFPCAPRPTASAAIAVDKETVVVGGSPDGGTNIMVYKTTRHGTRHWAAAPVLGASWPMSFDFDGANFLMGDSTSGVFISADGALTWSRLGVGDLDATNTWTSVAFDPGYAVTGDPGENTVYASTKTVIYRCVIDPIFPMAAQAWANIYNDAGADFWGMVTTGDTVLYVGDKAPTVLGDNGGMVRSLSPTAPLIVPNACEFERITFGLAANDRLSGLLLTSGVNGCPNSNVLWAVGLDATCPEVWFFEDTLATPVILTSPSNGAKGLSAVIGTTTATIEWEALCGATCYEKEVWFYCPGCDEKTFVPGFPHCFACHTLIPCVGCSGETCCEVVLGLSPGVTYYWRVRVGGVPGVCPPTDWPTAGCPMLSKWSETRTFTTALTVPTRCSPICGAEDITLTPNFSWSETPGATGYEIEVSLSEDFTTLLASGTPTINAWDGIPELEYSTTYYWRVRAARDGVVGAWTYCLFSTEEAPPEAPAPVWVCPQCGLTFTSEAALLAHIDAEHAPVPTPVYIWIIIAIGAALVIAVLILIVTTRRAP